MKTVLQKHKAVSDNGMLIFDPESENAQKLALHYSKKIGDTLAKKFFSSQIALSNKDEAYHIASIFWELSDLAADDNQKNIAVEGIVDLEFWMYKLLNITSGYMEKSGYKKQWLAAKDAYDNSITPSHSHPTP